MINWFEIEDWLRECFANKITIAACEIDYNLDRLTFLGSIMYLTGFIRDINYEPYIDFKYNRYHPLTIIMLIYNYFFNKHEFEMIKENLK